MYIFLLLVSEWVEEGMPNRLQVSTCPQPLAKLHAISQVSGAFLSMSLASCCFSMVSKRSLEWAQALMKAAWRSPYAAFW